MSCLFRAALAACVASTILAAAPAPARASGLAADIVTGTYSGLAIHGYDPVSYYLGKPEKGLPEYGALWGGIAWQFANDGNRQAFLAAPDVYLPAFGGHCAVSVARGEQAEGDPRLFVVHRGRTYLFFSEEARERFLLSPDGMAAQARRQWKKVAPLAPPELTPVRLPKR